jgi:nucleoside-diphosphate-sugar epimerase
MTDIYTRRLPDNALIIGYGDIGARLARLCLQRGMSVYGVARSAESAERMKNEKVTPVVADLDRPESLQGMPVADSAVFYLAPPPRRGEKDTRMRNFLEALEKNGYPDVFVYLGTSGVYGNQDGRLVTEDTPPAPGTDRARRRLDAEQCLSAYATRHAIDHVMLRVGGIYGPGRLPEKRIRDGVPVLHEELAPKTNRIHADDLATVCLAAAEHGRSGRIYNVSDGCSSNMTEYFYTVADHLGLPRPPAVDWEQAEKRIGSGMLSYLRESRRMDNTRMINELNVRLQYPDLSTGLVAMRKGE